MHLQLPAPQARSHPAGNGLLRVLAAAHCALKGPVCCAVQCVVTVAHACAAGGLSLASHGGLYRRLRTHPVLWRFEPDLLCSSRYLGR